MSATENPQGEPQRSNLENLENRLYSRTPPPLRHAEAFGQEERHIRIAPGWTEEAERKDSALLGIIGKIMPWLKRLFIASIIFALFAASVALYGFWHGANTVTSNNISLSVLGPVAAPAGEEMVLEVNIGNYNREDLDSVDLLVEYPEGTRKPSDVSQPLLRYRESLGPLAAGGTLSRRLSLVPFGEAGAKEQAHVTVEYRAKGSSPIFSRKSDYEFAINAAPVTVTVGAPQEVNSGQSFQLSVDITSNASSVIRNLLVKAQYPAGFEFGESSPAAAFSKDTWSLGDLKPGGKRTLTITGRIDGAEEEQRTFRIFVGTQSPKDEKLLGTVFLSEAPTVTVKKPFVGLDLLVNGEKGQTFIAKNTNGPLRADIVWANNLTTKLSDLEITAKLSGNIFDRASVESDGFYDSNTTTVRWDASNHPSFSSVDPGSGGTQSFSFNLLPVSTDPARYKNPSMQLVITAHAKRQDEAGAFQDVTSTFTKEIRIASSLSLGAELLYGTGAFVNTGPIPPQAEHETTYTVVWTLSNSSNGVANAKVSAVLPSYVKWQGQVSPSTESVTYNQLGGQVLWDAGDVASGVGFGAAPRQVAFQISILPSLSQVGTSPVLVSDMSAAADDRFTGAPVSNTLRSPLTTSSIPEGKGTVTK